MTNLFIFGNNILCLDAIRFLQTRPDTKIVGFCFNSKERQKYGNEIKDLLGESVALFDFEDLAAPNISQLQVDQAFSINFGHMIEKQIISEFDCGIINLHTSFLPFNRGSATNVFSIVSPHPAGVSLHYIDEGIDSGDIIAQKKIQLYSTDTGESLYYRLQEEMLCLFKDELDSILSNSFSPIPNNIGGGSLNTSADMLALDEIKLDQLYSGKEILDLLRARTFSNHESAYFIDEEGKRVYVRVCLSCD